VPACHWTHSGLDGALLVRCQFVGPTIPIVYDVSPAMMLFKPALLTYSLKCSLCACRKSNPNILVVQPAKEPRNRTLRRRVRERFWSALHLPAA
jgi:hypothetical protein